MNHTRRLRALLFAPLVLTTGCLMPSGWDNMHWSVYPQQAGDPATGAAPGVANPYGATPLQGFPPTAEGASASVGALPGVDPAVPPAKLYGWDGSVIEGQGEDPMGTPRQDSTPAARPRGVEPSLAGRMHIIELYQEVLDERDALAEEIQTLTTALLESQAQQAEHESSQEELLRRIAELEGSLSQMRKDFEEMGARLTTAQIRRLEAEKMLLETRIENERQAQASQATPASQEERP